jgi:hypothetical protein
VNGKREKSRSRNILRNSSSRNLHRVLSHSYAGSNCRVEPFTRRVVPFPRFRFKEPTLEALGHPALLWLPYQKFIPHRHWLSHAPVIGSAVRLLYLGVLLSPVAIAFIKALPPLKLGQEFLVYRCRCPGRVEVSALNHLLLDGLLIPAAQGHKGTAQGGLMSVLRTAFPITQKPLAAAMSRGSVSGMCQVCPSILANNRLQKTSNKLLTSANWLVRVITGYKRN